MAAAGLKELRILKLGPFCWILELLDPTNMPGLNCVQAMQQKSQPLGILAPGGLNAQHLKPPVKSYHTPVQANLTVCKLSWTFRDWRGLGEVSNLGNPWNFDPPNTELRRNMTQLAAFLAGYIEVSQNGGTPNHPSH